MRADVFDVIVVGGGPAGTTCAYGLASRGYSVLVLEKERHPRFHVGESLVPYASGLFEKMGILEQIENGPFVRKCSVQTWDPRTGYFRTYFSSLADGQKKFGFNVERASFDALLSEHARQAGAQVLEEAPVNDILTADGRVTGVGYEHDGRRREARARFVVGAAGRAGALSHQFKLRVMNRKLRNVAFYQYYDHVAKGVNSSDEGDLVVATNEDAWIWCIPVGSDTLSVGAVVAAEAVKESSPQELFDLHLRRAPIISDSLWGATPRFEDLKVESDFCYHGERLSGPGFFIAGDAACFVDPVFSGGVFLAMVAGMKAAEAIDDIHQGRPEPAARRHFDNFCKTGYDHYFRLVYDFYYRCHGNIARLFHRFPGQFKLVLQVLAGDFWGDEDNPVLGYLRAQPGWNPFQRPFPRVYGCPIYPDAHHRAKDFPSRLPAEAPAPRPPRPVG